MCPCLRGLEKFVSLTQQICAIDLMTQNNLCHCPHCPHDTKWFVSWLPPWHKIICPIALMTQNNLCHGQHGTNYFVSRRHKYFCVPKWHKLFLTEKTNLKEAIQSKMTQIFILLTAKTKLKEAIQSRMTQIFDFFLGHQNFWCFFFEFFMLRPFWRETYI